MNLKEFVTSEQVLEKYKNILEKLRDEHKKAEGFNRQVIISSEGRNTHRRNILREIYPPTPPSTGNKK